MSYGHGLRQALGLAVLAGLVACTLVYGFTTRTRAEAERARARTILGSIHQVELAYYARNGVYLQPDRENVVDVLKWANVPGVFKYRVQATAATFAAFAEADLDNDGVMEMWRVDANHAEPFVERED